MQFAVTPRNEGLPPPPPPPKPTKQIGGESMGTTSATIPAPMAGSWEQNGTKDNGTVAVAHRTLDEEQVVMTPLGKTNTSTVLMIERKLVQAVGDRTHVAGGDHRGIIINKDTTGAAAGKAASAREPAHLMLEFRVFLVSANTGQHTQESRRIKFWFRPWLSSDEEQAQVAQDFFRELVSPKEFPRDYVGFIKKLMKLLQKGYNEVQAIEVELRMLEQTSAPPSRPLSYEDMQFEVVPLTPVKILELIEQAYPNPITPEDLAKDYGWDEAEVLEIILLLKERGLIKSMEYNSYTRIHHDDQEIKIVKQMPTITSNNQPTIAIITAQYCEKLAVDAMIENKETFVRYTTVGHSPEKSINGQEQQRRRMNRFGESNVYTLGSIGAHRIVSTKLPSVGSTREAMTAAGNTTTRLLGTFQKVDYVFIVGVAGGVPHYTDYRKHVRLGDVVIAASLAADLNAVSVQSSQKPYCYVYNNQGDVKKYYPKNDDLQAIGRSLVHSNSDTRKPWVDYVREGLLHLSGRSENDFSRPDPSTDKLYMNIGNKDVIQVAHPVALQEEDVDGADSVAQSRLHLGPIGSGYDLVRSDSARTEYAQAHGLLATDVEMNSVLDSIVGNCRDSFILVKGISDYKDGTTSKKWQNHAALAAAAVMKTIICAMDAPKI
uniref:Winged helix-turn-helix domain-containing protein n=1 Tax=Anopheles darlingi TaxID=43151 RepID=A0A2M4CU34_ANODA